MAVEVKSTWLMVPKVKVQSGTSSLPNKYGGNEDELTPCTWYRRVLAVKV